MKSRVDSEDMIFAELLKTLQAKQETFFFKEALELYIPPQMGRFVGDDEPKDAAETIEAWLKDPDKKCLLLLGDSGVGKTLFGQWLTRQSFEKHNLQGRIPLFIPLLAQRYPYEDLIDRYLKKTCEIEDKNKRGWIKQQPLLLILDGFDEIHQKINLYRANKLWQLKDLKIIISCRSQALENIYNYNSLFYPCDSEGKLQPQKLQEYVVNPFTEKQIDAYLQRYVSTHQNEIKLSHPDWVQWQIYQAYIQKLPGLQSLLNSPFILSILVQVLPSIIAKHQGKENIEQLHLARINLYDYFVEQWFARQKLKLLNARHISDNCPIEDLFIKCSKSIANAMLQNNKTSIELTLNTINPLLAQQGFFGDEKSKLYAEKKDIKETKNTEIKYIDEEIIVNSDKIKLSLILSGCPVMKLQDNQYAFLHKSLLEYFAARKLFEGVMVDASIALGCELNEKLLINEPAVLKNLAEIVEQDDKLKQRLFDVLDESKFDERIEIAAANAITILNYAGVSFSQKRLRRIRIKGADLSNAILDSTDLREADLREVSLRNAWLNNAKLGSALMQKVEFGELSYMEVEEPVICIVYSPDGRFLAVGTNSGAIQLFDVVTGKRIATLKGHTQTVNSVAFSPDGSLFASGGGCGDNSVRLWDARNQKFLGALKGHTDDYNGGVTSVAFSPGGKYLASNSGDKFVYLWDAKTQKSLGVLKGHTDKVQSVAFSPNGSYLASSSDKFVYIWDAKTQKSLGVLKGHTEWVNCVAFSPDGNLLVSGSFDKSLRLWDIKNQKSLGVLNGHTNSVNCVTFSSDGSLLVSGSSDNSVRLWDAKNQKLLGALKGHTQSVVSVAFSPDGSFLASAGLRASSVRFWNPIKQQALGVLKEQTEDVKSIACSPDGSCLASGGGFFGRTDSDYPIRLWNPKNYKSLGLLKGHTAVVRSVAFSPDGKVLASGDWNNSVHLWDTNTQKSLGVLKGHITVTTVNSIAFSPDGNLLVSGGAYGYICLWDAKDQRSLGAFRAHTNDINSIAFSPDGKILATVAGDPFGSDKSVCFWDAKNQKLLGMLNGHTSGIPSIAFSPDGLYLASGSCDKSIRLWDAKSQQCLGVLNGHTYSVVTVAFSPDGNYLASGSYDNSVRLWDVKTRKCLSVLKLARYVSAFAFKKEEEKMYLYLASGTAIYTFEIKYIQSKFEFILHGSVGHEAGLKSAQLDLGGVVGLEQQNERLLKQHEAIGTLSTKETDKVLEARNQSVPYNSKQPQYDLFSQQHLITPQHAMVSMVRKKDSKHAFLVIESIQDNHYIITRGDFVIDMREKHSIGKIISTGQALIEICVKPLTDMQELALQCVYKPWRITDDQAYGLLANLEADRLKCIHYLNLGNNSFYKKSKEEAHSCLTWCEEHLSKIGIDVSEQKSWLDAIFANPLSRLPDNGSNSNIIQNITSLSGTDNKDKQREPKQNCLMM